MEYNDILHKYICYVFWKVYYKVDESKEKEKDDLVASVHEDVSARHVEEDSEGLAGREEENDIAVGKISKTEDDDIDTSKTEEDDVDSNKIEDLPVRGNRAKISDWVENLYAFTSTMSF